MGVPILSLRIAIVRNVTRTFVECKYPGNTSEKTIKCPITYPYVSGGGGFLHGIEIGTLVLIGTGPSEEKFIVAYLPWRATYSQLEGVSNVPYYQRSIPELEEGELMMRSSRSGSFVDILPDGNIIIDAKAGQDEGDFELSPLAKGLFTRTDNKYEFTEAGRSVEGIVKRDKHKTEYTFDTSTVNFLSGDLYDDLLSPIGRSPTDEVQNRTTTIVRDFTRNPALVEKREVIYEYANSFGVRNVTAEAKAMITMENTDGTENLVVLNGSRQDRRTDILNLNMFNYNHLAERVVGTVVDIYGNVLDINRNVINIPDIESLDKKNGTTKALQNLYRYMRRSIKYHFEINSRKEIEGDEPPRTVDNISDYAREHSRWSIDIDGEGLTKINIPASSETGNIPVLNRHLTSVSSDKDGNAIGDERDDGQFRDKDFVDIRSIPFGQDTQQISNSEYAPKTVDNKSITTAGTAYHDLMNVAPLIFDSGKLRNPNPGKGSSTVKPLSESIDNKIGSQNANAGGRSMHANLDGSVEMSIGADTVDNKSMLLDLQGAMISHFGKDKNGRSIIHQNDGDVIIQIGGEGIDDSGFRPGRMEIHLARQGGNPQRIIIDEQGITIDVEGNALFSSSGDFTIGAGGRLLLAGELIFNYGAFDEDIDGTRSPTGTERLVLRNGIPDYM